jgi:O-methyltransferase
VEMFSGDPESFGYGFTDAPSVRNNVLRALAKRGLGFRRTYGSDVPAYAIETFERVRPYTMTSARSVIGLCEAVEYIVKNEIVGDFVECGVWRGGSIMAAAITLLRLGINDRELYLFDTFAGMPAPSEADRSLTAPDQRPADRWQRDLREDHNEWAYAPLEAVLANVASTGYPREHVHLVKGPVEETIPDRAPQSIALLRLDTDWYSSTRHELEHLYPRLVPGGVVIFDDYGAWAGHRQAVDDYEPARRLLLSRLDDFARIAVKPDDR